MWANPRFLIDSPERAKPSLVMKLVLQRDRQYGKVEWGTREFSLVDTGGWVVNSDDIFEEEIRKQVVLATEEADLILFVVDVQNGITDLDTQVAQILRRAKTPVILCANKTDQNEDRYGAPEFYAWVG